MESTPPDSQAPSRGALADGRRRVLVVDDDRELRALLRALLEAEGFAVDEAADGREALGAILAAVPSLLVVDEAMPGMRGTELVARLRRHPGLASLPIAMLTASGDVEDRVRGLDAGADEYVAKPFAATELVARLRALLRRSERDLSTDALTRLPGNPALRTEIGRRLDAGRPFDLAYADLDHFKPYADHHGFERATAVIQETARLLSQALLDWGDPEDFLGHVGGDDFVMLLARDTAAAVCQAAVDRLAEAVPKLYDAEARERGFIEGVDRFGTPRRFPLLSLSVALVSVEPGEFRDRDQLAAHAARGKQAVKSRGGGRWVRFTGAATRHDFA